MSRPYNPMKPKPSTSQVRCKHPLRSGAQFCHVCGMPSTNIGAGPTSAMISAGKTVRFVPSPAHPGNCDLGEITANALAISLDGEVRNLQKELVEQRHSSPDSRQHRAAAALTLIAAAIALSILLLAQPSRSWSYAWLAGLAAFMSVVGILRYTTQRRAYQAARAIQQKEYRRLEKKLAESWRRLDALQRHQA